VSNNSGDRKWRVPSEVELLWHRWGDQYVVFNSASGDTHLLDGASREGLLCLQERALDQSELSRHLAARLELAADEQVQRYAARLLERLAKLGLIEPADPEAIPP